MKILASFLIVAVVGVGTWFYFNQGKKDGATPRIPVGAKEEMERPKIDPEAFNREEALQSLMGLEAASTLTFSSYAYKSAEPAVLPESLSPFVTPASGERVKVQQDAYDPSLLKVTYFSENPMPENYLNQLRLARQNEFKVIRGVRSELSSTIDLESDTIVVRISQLAVNEERTEVIISIKSK
jgi:hypothetical protein